jgi:toxin ParE1/3/4
VNGKPVIPRDVAFVDVEDAVDYYADAGGKSLALRFIAALNAAYTRVAQHPGAGSPRYEIALGLDGLRFVTLRGFPYLVFYTEAPALIDVWRVLHAQRDLDAELLPGDED